MFCARYSVYSNGKKERKTKKRNLPLVSLGLFLKKISPAHDQPLRLLEYMLPEQDTQSSFKHEAALFGRSKTA